MNKKLMLASALSSCGVLKIIRYTAKSTLMVVNYHRVHADGDPTTFFDDGVISSSASHFQDCVNWLKSNTKVLNEEEVIQAIDSNHLPARFCSLITFDDGYIDNYVVAYPILKKLHLPAIFFVPTQQVTLRQLGWWDIIAYLIKNTSKSEIIFDAFSFALPSQKEEAIKFFLQKMKLEHTVITETLVEQLAEICDVGIPSSSSQDAELMNWNQIREVSQNNIAIGAHTHTHRVLATLDAATQYEELALSKKILEKEIGREVRSFAYPVGNYQHFTRETQKIVEQCGYKLAFSNNTGINFNNIFSSRFDIKRISVPDNVNVLECMMVLPQIFILKPLM